MQDRAASRSDGVGVSPLVVAQQASHVGVRLVRAAPQASEPFVVLHEDGAARVLLAEVAAGAQPLLRFALRLRRDDAPAGAGGSAPHRNREVDEHWQRERDELARIDSPHFVAAVPVPDSLLRSLPLFHCRQLDRCFHPVSPTTGEPLRVCRDDAVLGARGLPGYAQDVQRYLYAGRGDGGDDELYGRDRLAELVRDWGRLVHDGGRAAATAATHGFPCVGCEFRHECHAPPAASDRAGSDPEAAGLAAERLAALSFYDVDAVALQLAERDFGAAMALLTSASGDWLVAAEPRQRALEVLRLKLAAFGDVCRGLAAVHALGRPHLGVAPHNIVVFADAAGSSVPERWRQRFALTGLGSAVQARASAGRPLLRPGPQMIDDPDNRRFVAPALRLVEGQTVTMSVICRAVDESGGRTRLVVDVHRAGVPPFVLAGDLLRVKPVDDVETRSARVDETSARGLSATILAHDVEACRGWAGREFSAQLSFVRALNASADLYGLGMLLLRMLVVHEDQDLQVVADAAERCLQRLFDEPVQDGRSAQARWQQLLDGAEGEGRFAWWHVLSDVQQRLPARHLATQGQALVPTAAWHAALALAGRLLIAQPAFGGGGGGGGSRLVDQVLMELEVVQRLIDVELFDRDRRDAAIAAACDAAAAALRAEVAPVPAAAADGTGGDAGFTLTIERVGDARVFERRFRDDRVTIGRREQDNTLPLNDPMVSSKHAVIERDEHGYAVFDCGSTNGTEVDGIRLPIEVSQPLDDGTEIHIRPFKLVFRSGAAVGEATAVAPVWNDDEVLARLSLVYADGAALDGDALHAALRAVLDRAAETIGRAELLARLEPLQQRLVAARFGGDASAVRQEQVREASTAALMQLARALLGGAGLDDADQVREFGARLQRFVEATAQWIEDTLELRRVLGSHLDLRATNSGFVRSSLRTAADVRRHLLGPQADEEVAASGYFLARFYEDVLDVIVGLLQANRQSRQALRERLDPARLVVAAGREAKLGFLVQAAAGSALWKLYRQVFVELTGDETAEVELVRLLEHAAERRARRR